LILFLCILAEEVNNKIEKEKKERSFRFGGSCAELKLRLGYSLPCLSSVQIVPKIELR